LILRDRRRTQVVRQSGTVRWTTFAPASPLGPSTVSRMSSARTPNAIRAICLPISDQGLRDSLPAEHEQIADKDTLAT
jgi:hypothetical protein